MNEEPTLHSTTNESPDSASKKQQLEIENLEAQNTRLNLQADEIRCNNNLGHRLAPYIPVISVIIGVVGFLYGTYQSRHAESQRQTAANVQKERENDIREKELAQKISSQYRDDLDQLLQFPTNEKQTVPVAIFLLSDLENLIENKSQGLEKEQRQKEVGNLLLEIIGQADFDLSKSRNVEFDRIAMTNCRYYSNMLASDPRLSTQVLNKYHLALESIHATDGKLIESVILDGEFIQTEIPFDKHALLRRFQDLMESYKEHVEIMKKGLTVPAVKDAYVHRAFCWFYAATNNHSCTSRVFAFDDYAINEHWRTCTENDES